ncbi:hypothetical protein LshimejAT787_0500210 [Lyophyllum shimeji]|uniref:Uncharacterized protein n=1 Tax=Lyophyllum shimeji TaxID=47721 RepID=A0A9P3UPC2_LYOSH|nr:hypothetical protein LshimejAT787_0500210 [Lyophyllum shimeji]
MAPLAGKPPYATDLPDSYYESAPAPQRRVRQQPPPNPNDRTSAYDVYSNYLNDDKAGNRQSGVGALGLGLMNMDDDDDDDDHSYARHKAQQPASSPAVSPSKHAALAAATAAANASPSRNVPAPSPPHIAAPQPGYAAPIAALNTLARPDPVATPQGRAPPPFHPQAPEPRMANPFADPHPPPMSQHTPYHLTTSPTPSEPHPLQPPMTPITPVFARPAKSAIKFSDTNEKPIMRSNTEDTPLPRRGRKKPTTQKTSLWLSKTRAGTTRLSRWVWIVGIILLACIAFGVGIGWYVSHKSPSHQQPKAFGGSANEYATAASTSTAGGVGPGGSTIRHVSPTHTVERRVFEPQVTAVSRTSPLHKRRLPIH